ncbi:MAG: hypothetical protein B6D41_16730 [Chloroflexi bacterium UTCFX4]|jgi:predicted nucleic acid-binding protein|nr:MAG: hypothetical protein B6D41_16730 [Chloroflexi bacterium UTCFX4]
MPQDDFVISNTSPLFYLHQIEQINLLRDLYSRVHVPQGVLTELRSGEKLGLKIPRLEAMDWVSIEQISIAQHLRRYTELGQGELEAISLGLNSPLSRIILDDRAARDVAKENNLEIIGTIGILLAAKQKGLVTAISPLLATIRNKGFRMSESMLRDALRRAGE